MSATPLTVTRIAHASQLTTIGELRVLTDPWFTQTATYYQGEPVTASVATIGAVDALVITHEHYDHCDLDALVDGGFDLATPLVGRRTVFFGGDTLRIPDLDEIPGRFGPVDLAILPVNGLCIRPANLEQVVMDAEEAAGLAAVLGATVTLPHHYAFHSGFLGDRMITKGDQDPRHFTDALARIAPHLDARAVLPGIPVTVGTRQP